MATTYCVDCGHDAQTHSLYRGCYAYGCGCQLKQADCVDGIGYRDAQPGDHDPAVCAAMRKVGATNGYHAGWGLCGRDDDPSEHDRPATVSPFVRRALAAQLPAKVLA